MFELHKFVALGRQSCPPGTARNSGVERFSYAADFYLGIIRSSSRINAIDAMREMVQKGILITRRFNFELKELPSPQLPLPLHRSTIRSSADACCWLFLDKFPQSLHLKLPRFSRLPRLQVLVDLPHPGLTPRIPFSCYWLLPTRLPTTSSDRLLYQNGSTTNIFWDIWIGPWHACFVRLATLYWAAKRPSPTGRSAVALSSALGRNRSPRPRPAAALRLAMIPVLISSRKGLRLRPKLHLSSGTPSIPRARIADGRLVHMSSRLAFTHPATNTLLNSNPQAPTFPGSLRAVAPTLPASHRPGISKACAEDFLFGRWFYLVVSIWTWDPPLLAQWRLGGGGVETDPDTWANVPPSRPIRGLPSIPMRLGRLCKTTHPRNEMSGLTVFTSEGFLAQKGKLIVRYPPTLYNKNSASLAPIAYISASPSASRPSEMTPADLAPMTARVRPPRARRSRCMGLEMPIPFPYRKTWITGTRQNAPVTSNRSANPQAVGPCMANSMPMHKLVNKQAFVLRLSKLFFFWLYSMSGYLALDRLLGGVSRWRRR
ncbi:hypothetical protein BC834DRAFT_993308 [Gloeopeniophorella convolvens]|nr:hypothetical protein BC834DRAFT_993308 [Gloeopeniophorella convolvens]